MTAFTRCENQGPWGSLIWEVRSVNHRYLEPSLRLPDELRALEGPLRERLNQMLNRGKVDCTLRWQSATSTNTGLVINQTLVTDLLNVLDALTLLLPHAAPPDPLRVLQWPGVVQKPEPDLAAVRSAAFELFELAIDDLIAARGREGARLAALIAERCKIVSTTISELRRRMPGIIAALREKLSARVAELAANFDPTRMEQELALLVQRHDVDEELDRVDSHLVEVGELLTHDKPIGRRLDFLMQELHREANTLGSKTADITTTRTVVDLKVLIEQMREQVQNIE